MIDAPETAMAAVSVWAILATERFSRLRVCAAAGLAVGLGMLTKEPFVFYVAGPLLVTALRGGPNAWRGLLVFALVASIVALPWYVSELSRVGDLGKGAVSGAGTDPVASDIAPHRFSLDNLGWYTWSLVNYQVYLPLFVLSAIGWVWTLAGFARGKLVSPYALELAVGSFVAWFAITETFAHDVRYSLPLLVYLAVFGTGWIVGLLGRGRAIAVATLVLVAIVNTLGASFGVGTSATLRLGSKSVGLQRSGVVTFLADTGFLVGAPHRDGDVLSELRGIRRSGVRYLVIDARYLEDPSFSADGLQALGRIAGLKDGIVSFQSLGSVLVQYAYLEHDRVARGTTPPCVKLSDGTGVRFWVAGPGNAVKQEVCPPPGRHPT